ncbi:bactofilin family protein [Paucidesulfovibrio longus]|uniref:bactofilin family protein n=1 Tax=Paucidesulfovibrio longus TaxID=889 RepID=UPI0003B645B0|nr:polymer-forming cytoskeletal protein [Paucidesulfovibrio longus]
MYVCCVYDTQAIDRRSGERGNTLIYIVVALVAFGVIASVSATRYATTTSAVMRPNCALQAEYMAESGMRYAMARLRACASESAVTDAVLDMNGKTYVVDDGTGMSFTLAVTYSSGAATVNSTGTSCSTAEPATASTGNLTFNLPAASGGGSEGGDGAAVLGGIYGGTAATISGDVIGDVITQSVTIRGGSSISGSLTFLGTSTCLSISGGARVGTLGENNTLCSLTCVVVKGGATVNGDLNAQGDVSINSGTVNGDIRSAGGVTNSNGTVNGSIYAQDSVSITGTVHGDVYSGGDVFIGWGGTVTGDIYCTGTATSPGGFRGSVTTGYDKAEIALPEICQSYTFPEHKTVASTQALVINADKVFTGVADLGDTSNAYTSITSSGWHKICFDLSTPGTYINIFCSGDMSFHGELYVRTSSSVPCFSASNRVSSTSFAEYAEASRVYMDVKGNVSFGGGVSWFGTIYAGGDIRPGSGGSYIGGLYANGELNPGNSWFSSRFVASDYIGAFWP